MANKKKFYGKRMVPEYLITKLEELEPGGGDYTAGNGIDIEDNEISIDDTIVATKTDLEDYELKSDAFSGSYNDLTDKPTIPAAQVQSDWSQSDNTQVDYIKNKPTIPDTTNMVTTNTNQTITGEKTFTGSNVKINALGTANDHISMGYDDVGGVPSITFYDSNYDPSAAIFTDANDVLTFNGLSGVSFKNGIDKTFNIPSKADGTYTLATTDDIPDEVSGTNDGTNWTSLTIGNDTYDIPQGGGSSYTFTNGLTESSGTVGMDLWSTGYQYQDSYSNSTIKINSGTRAINLSTHKNYKNITNSMLLCDGDEVAKFQITSGIDVSGDKTAKLMFGRTTGTYSDLNYIFTIGQYNPYSSPVWNNGLEVDNNHLIYNKLNSSSPYNSKVFEVSNTTLDYNNGKMTVDTNGNMVLAGSITATNLPASPDTLYARTTTGISVTTTTQSLTFTGTLSDYTYLMISCNSVGYYLNAKVWGKTTGTNSVYIDTQNGSSNPRLLLDFANNTIKYDKTGSGTITLYDLEILGYK